MAGADDDAIVMPVLLRSEPDRRRQTSVICDQVRSWAADPTSADLVARVLPSIERLAFDAPFADLRQAFRELYDEVGPSGRRPAPCVSRMLPREAFSEVGAIPDGPPLYALQDMFLLTGRIASLDRIIAMQPSFLVAYVSSYVAIMYDDGPLSLPCRSYLAALASARLHCQYLIRQQAREFVRLQGPVQWLHDRAAVPDKLRLFDEVNALMAHQPWRLTPALLRSMLSHSDLSVSELVHGIVILSTFHALCGLAQGLGAVDTDDDSDERSTATATTPKPAPPDSDEATQHLKVLLQTSMDVLLAQATSLKATNHAHSGAHSAPVTATQQPPAYPALCAPVLADMQYEDYNVKSKIYRVLHMGEFDWKGHGYSLISRYWNDHTAQLLDDEFDLIYALTDNNLCQSVRDIDTGPFRRAIWHYTFRLFGVSDDAYNYQEVNIFLNRGLKAFIKKCACFPHLVTGGDFVSLGYSLRPDEIVHVALLAMEARRQATLLYALRALQQSTQVQTTAV
ncbi:Sestrin [Plasmodiophora brassicae]